MSLVKSKAIQLGFDATPTNNFLIYQPLTPDGTFRIANGNQGATTDIMTVTSGGSVTFAGTTNFSSLNFGAGSESAPSLFPTGDSNTGIWFPAADTFAVSTGGTERIRIGSTGNVGIGINNPTTKLYVKTVLGSNTGSNSLTIHNEGWATGIALAHTYGVTETSRIVFDYYGSEYASNTSHGMNYVSGRTGYSNHWFRDYLGNTQMVISNSGYVGIGNASPVYALDIATPNSGNIAWQRTGVAAKKWGISSDNYGTYFGNVTDAVWNILTLSNAGNVGVGVGSSAIAKLTVASSDDLDGGKALSVYGTSAPAFNNSTSNVAGPVNFAYLASTGKKSVVSVMSRNSGVAGNNYTSYTGEIAELRLCGTGTDQSTAIQAASIIATTSDSSFGNTVTTRADIIFTARGTGATDRISSPERMRITGSGQLGIGTGANTSHMIDVLGGNGQGDVVIRSYANRDFTYAGLSYPRMMGLGIINHNNASTRTSIQLTSSKWYRSSYGGYIGQWIDVDSGPESGTQLVGQMVKLSAASGGSSGYIGSHVDLTGVFESTGYKYGLYVDGEGQNYFSGTVGIGTTSPISDAKLVLSKGGNAGLEFSIDNAVAGTNRIFSYNRTSSTNVPLLYAAATHTWNVTNANNAVFLNDSGKLGINTTNPGSRLEVVGPSSAEGTATTVIRNGATGDMRPMYLYTSNSSNLANGHIFIDTAAAGATNWFFLQAFTGTSTSQKAYIRGDGTFGSATGSYGGLSDARIKKDIVDATPKLDKLLQVRVVNYIRTDEENQDKELGVIAQELEEIFPGLVYETEIKSADGTVVCPDRKNVKYSVFIPILIKAMQEQQEIIKSLQARLDAAGL